MDIYEMFPAYGDPTERYWHARFSLRDFDLQPDTYPPSPAPVIRTFTMLHFGSERACHAYFKNAEFTAQRSLPRDVRQYWSFRMRRSRIKTPSLV